MRIEHSVKINAELQHVWDVFVDISCWNDWNTVAVDVRSDTGRLTEGKRFEFCIKPFVLPLNIRPVVEKLVPGKHVIWSGSKYGINARHEFVFEECEGGVKVTSREIFDGKALKFILVKFTYKSLNRLSVRMLQQLKDAAENGIDRTNGKQRDNDGPD